MAARNRRNTNRSNSDNRRAQRYPFEVEQRIAVTVAGELPPPDKFETVRCIDLSRGGFAFYRPALLDGSNLVVELGKAPDLVYLMARVVQSRAVTRDRRPAFRIGCQFVGRLASPGQSQDLAQPSDMEDALRMMSGESAAAQAADAPSA